MLSAIAARKAALAAQTPTPADNTPSPASGSHAPSLAPSRNGTKRKPSTQKSRPEAKKPKKAKAAPMLNKSVDDFKYQKDMLVVEDSDDDVEDDESDSAMSVLDAYEQETLPKLGQKAIKRAWSPSQPVDDSSDEETLEQDSIPLDMSSLFPSMSTSKLPAEDNGILSTFTPVVDQNVFILSEFECASLGLSAPATLVGLTPIDSLCLLGTCILTVLQGSLTLSGTTIHSSSTRHPVFAPRSSPLPILRPALASHSQSILNTTNLSTRLLPILDFKTVFAIQANKTSVEGLGRICRTFDGVFEPSRWQKSRATAPFEISGIYMITQQSKDLHTFLLPPSWSEALNGISNQTENIVAGTYVIKGSKNSGKSTFARTLVNRLLGSYRHVAYLECDLGQSEFTPGGMVALNVISNPLFGPPFTHPTLPNYAHFIGSTTPRSNPSHYLDAIQALVEVYRLDIQTPAIESIDESDPRLQDCIPLVVNTMGWTKGLGADLTQKIENLVDVTEIFDIQAPVREEYPVAAPIIPIAGTFGTHYSHVAMDASTAAVHTLESISSFSAAAGYTAADHRSLSILSYLHARFPLDAVPGELEQITALSWDTSRPLCAVPPYEIDCSIALDKIILTGAGSEDVVEGEIAQVLNAAIVGLVRCEPGTIDTNPGENPPNAGIPYTRPHPTPSPVSSNCVGLGLIRGVSPPRVDAQGVAKTHLQILTPVPHALLAQARVLVKGEMELPVWGMLDFRNFYDGKDVDPGDVAGVEREKVPFLQWGKAPEGVMGAERRRVRRNLMRRGQM